MALDPEAAAFIEQVRANGSRQVGELNIEDMRAAAEAVIPLGYDFEEVARVDEIAIPVSGGQVPAHIYSSGRNARPIVLWLHGGSFTRCGPRTHDTLWRRFANRTQSIVVGLDFRLAPEFKHPVALEDAYSAATWIHDKSDELGGDGRIFVLGESSGGTLAAALSLLARERGAPTFSGVLLVLPLLDRDSGTASRRELAEDYLLTSDQIEWAYDQYAPGADRDDFLVYPYRAGDLGGLPPTFVVTVEYDPLRDEGEQFVERLKAAGGTGRAVRVPGLIHSALMVPKAIGGGAFVTDQAIGLFTELAAGVLGELR